MTFRIASHCCSFGCSMPVETRPSQRRNEPNYDSDDAFNLTDENEEDDEPLPEVGQANEFYYSSICEEDHDMRYRSNQIFIFYDPCNWEAVGRVGLGNSKYLQVMGHTGQHLQKYPQEIRIMGIIPI